MAIDPADKKYFNQPMSMLTNYPENMAYSPNFLRRQPRNSPANTNLASSLYNRRQEIMENVGNPDYRKIISLLPEDVQGDIDPRTGVPWDMIINLVAIAESSGDVTKHRGQDGASGPFQFLPDTERLVVEYLNSRGFNLQVDDDTGRQIRAVERPLAVQEAMFRVLWGTGERIPGVNRGPGNWSESEKPKEGEKGYEHMWGRRMDLLQSADPADRQQVYNEILANDKHPDFNFSYRNTGRLPAREFDRAATTGVLQNPMASFDPLNLMQRNLPVVQEQQPWYRAMFNWLNR